MRCEGGFSLIEVLVAAAVMAFGLSGLAALLLSGVTVTSDADHGTTAALLADGLAAQVRLAPGARTVFLSPAPASAPNCAAPGSCTPAQFAAHALRRWHANIAASLPQGTAAVCRDASPNDGSPASHACDGSGPLVLKIFWRDRLAAGSRYRRHTAVVAS